MADASYEQMASALRYEPESGKLFWLERPESMFPTGGDGGAARAAASWNTQHAGKEAFSMDAYGYGKIGFCGRNYGTHRVAWLLYYGSWPKGHIDHINGNTADNRIENLRIVTDAENAKNKRLSPKNTSGINGVNWDKRCGRWRAQIRISRRSKHLGLFDRLEDAVAARAEANRRHGFHENHGLPVSALAVRSTPSDSEGV